MERSLDLSVVVPVYRQEEKAIKKYLRQMLEVLEGAGLSFEVILVIDGPTSSPLRQGFAGLRGVLIFNLKKNFGKGYAVCFGMKKAKGEMVAFIDGGGEFGGETILFFYHFIKATGADIVVGSKRHPASEVSYPLLRKILSWGYQVLTRVLFGLWVRDTQVGVKIFKRQVIKKVVPKLLVKSYAFDVEMLAVANHFGFKKIYEAPIKLKWKGGVGLSSKKIWFVILRMMWDTWSVFYRLRVRKYYD